jgi:hypothetical protein
MLLDTGLETVALCRGVLTYSVALVRERTMPTERPPLVGEVSVKFCGYRVPRGQRDGSLRPYYRLSGLNYVGACGTNCWAVKIFDRKYCVSLQELSMWASQTLTWRPYYAHFIHFVMFLNFSTIFPNFLSVKADGNHNYASSPISFVSEWWDCGNPMLFSSLFPFFSESLPSLSSSSFPFIPSF